MQLAAYRLAILAVFAILAVAGNAATGNPSQAGREGRVAPTTTDSVYFNNDSVALDESSIARLSTIFGAPGDNGSVVTLRGYRDNLSSSAYELAIGQKRLDAVRATLLSTGFPATKIKTELLGEHGTDAPPCQDEDCQRQSRRVDIFVQR